MYVESVGINIGNLQGFELGTFQTSTTGQVVASVTLNGAEVQGVVTQVEFSFTPELLEQIREQASIAIRQQLGINI